LNRNEKNKFTTIITDVKWDIHLFLYSPAPTAKRGYKQRALLF